MLRKGRVAPFAYQLDVIVEEDGSDSIGTFNNVNEKSFQTNQVAQSNPCTFTSRKYTPPSEIGPQFLHSGEWPRTDQKDTLIEITTRHADDTYSLKTSNLVSSKELCDASDTVPNSTKNATEQTVTTDQLSMVVDYWYPSEYSQKYGVPEGTTTQTSTFTTAESCITVTSIQESTFQREIMAEHLTRTRAVEHIEELEDNDSAIEIVAMLESHRQHGWAQEMIKAFPHECWLLWCDSGLAC